MANFILIIEGNVSLTSLWIDLQVPDILWPIPDLMMQNKEDSWVILSKLKLLGNLYQGTHPVVFEGFVHWFQSEWMAR